MTGAGALKRPDKSIEVERLRQDVMRIELMLQGFASEGARADNHDRDIAQRRFRELLRTKIPPVHQRHHHVEHDRVDPDAGPQLIERVDAVACRNHPVTLRLEEVGDAVEDPEVVVDEQRPAHHRSRRKLGRCLGWSGSRHSAPPGNRSCTNGGADGGGIKAGPDRMDRFSRAPRQRDARPRDRRPPS